ncbi:hypothetical protein R3P38DRAFT_2782768 [Favolaschia claudopus]|uniref:Uncharacterized protein n=1 Tax=Favolaschia claudopus TaxID=2862362 RepID=A0AAW0B2R3_9AGAR
MSRTSSAAEQSSGFKDTMYELLHISLVLIRLTGSLELHKWKAPELGEPDYIRTHVNGQTSSRFVINILGVNCLIDCGFCLRCILFGCQLNREARTQRSLFASSNCRSAGPTCNGVNQMARLKLFNDIDMLSGFGAADVFAFSRAGHKHSELAWFIFRAIPLNALLAPALSVRSNRRKRFTSKVLTPVEQDYELETETTPIFVVLAIKDMNMVPCSRSIKVNPTQP